VVTGNATLDDMFAITDEAEIFGLTVSDAITTTSALSASLQTEPTLEGVTSRACVLTASDIIVVVPALSEAITSMSLLVVLAVFSNITGASVGTMLDSDPFSSAAPGAASTDDIILDDVGWISATEETFFLKIFYYTT
jgi:hypothetical protein